MVTSYDTQAGSVVSLAEDNRNHDVLAELDITEVVDKLLAVDVRDEDVLFKIDRITRSTLGTASESECHIQPADNDEFAILVSREGTGAQNSIDAMTPWRITFCWPAPGSSEKNLIMNGWPASRYTLRLDRSGRSQDLELVPDGWAHDQFVTIAGTAERQRAFAALASRVAQAPNSPSLAV